MGNQDSGDDNSNEDILEDEDDEDPNLSDTGKAIQLQIKNQLKELKTGMEKDL